MFEELYKNTCVEIKMLDLKPKIKTHTSSNICGLIPTTLRPCMKYEHEQDLQIGKLTTTDKEPEPAKVPMNKPLNAELKSKDSMPWLHSKIIQQRETVRLLEQHKRVKGTMKNVALNLLRKH